MIWWLLAAVVVVYALGYYAIGLRLLAPRYVDRKVAEAIEHDRVAYPHLWREPTQRMKTVDNARKWALTDAKLLALVWMFVGPVRAIQRLTDTAITTRTTPSEVELKARRDLLEAEIARLEESTDRLRAEQEAETGPDEPSAVVDTRQPRYRAHPSGSGRIGRYWRNKRC